MNEFEWLGLCASCMVLISMCFKTTTRTGRLLMRLINGCGSVVFVCYGLIIHSLSLIILNVTLTVINFYYLIKERKETE